MSYQLNYYWWQKALYRDPHDFPNATKLSEAGQQIIANMANLYQSVLADL